MNTSILITNVANFETLTTLEGEISLGPWMENNGYSLISLDPDADGEYGYVAVVAQDEVSLSLEAQMKLEIALELEDLEEDTEDFDVAAFVNPTAFTPPTVNKTAKGGKMKAHEYLAELITNNPGISRTDVFTNAALRSKFLSKVVSTKIDAGDKLETKRYNRRLNRFIRQIRRDGTDIKIERTGRVAAYTIADATQLEIPFTLQAEARNSAIIGPIVDEVLEDATPIAFTRAEEDVNVSLSFEDLLSTLDDEAVATVAK